MIHRSKLAVLSVILCFAPLSAAAQMAMDDAIIGTPPDSSEITMAEHPPVALAGTTDATLSGPHDIIPNFAVNPTITSKQSGNWSSPTTWDKGRVPATNDVVKVLYGTTVTYDSISSASLAALGVEGVLTFSPSVNTFLKVGTILVYSTGRFDIGTPGAPIQSNVRAEVIIANRPLYTTTADPNTGQLDPKQFGTGLISFGEVIMYGASMSPTWVKLATEPRAGNTTLSLSSAPTGWRVGDTLVLPDSRQLNLIKTGSAPAMQIETPTIASISGTTVTLSSPLRYDHLGAHSADGTVNTLPHVGDITHNILIHSESPTGTRGHALFTARARVDIRYAEFKDLSRTTDDPLDSTDTSIGHIGTNQIGRYAVHFHYLEGPTNSTNTGYQFAFVGNSIVGSLKWAMSLHNAHFGYVGGNVIYDVGGAGIVTEMGNETQNVIENNFVVKVGQFVDGPYQPVYGGVGNGGGQGIGGDTRERPLGFGDFGWEGSAFWLISMDNYVRGNVAANAAFAGFNYNGRPAGGFAFNNPIVPKYRGADINTPSAWTGYYPAPSVRQATNNEVYASAEGMWVSMEAFVGTMSNFLLWHIRQEGFYTARNMSMAYDNFTLLNNQSVSNQNPGKDGFSYSTGFELDGRIYQGGASKITNFRVEGFNVGFEMPSSVLRAGETPPFDYWHLPIPPFVSLLDTGHLRNYVNVLEMSPNSNSSKDTVIRNVKFIQNPGPPLLLGQTFDRSRAVVAEPAAIVSSPDIVWGDWQNRETQHSSLYLFDYNQIPGNNFEYFFPEQGQSALAQNCPELGLTNAQCWARYNVAMLEKMPTCTDTTSHPEMKGITCAVPTGVTAATISSAPTPYVLLKASAATISAGQSVTLTWSGRNLASCTGRTFSGSGISGSTTVSPTKTTLYTITCIGTSGTLTGGAVMVTVGSTPVPTAQLWFSPQGTMTTTAGHPVQMNWASTNATSCSSTNFLAPTLSGSINVSPTQTTLYSMLCTGPGGSVPAQLTMTVLGSTGTFPTATLTASPLSIVSGQSSTLTWVSTNATSCTGTGFSTGNATANTTGVTVTPSVTTTYSITCTGSGGTSPTASATVTVSSITPSTSLIQNITTTGDFSQTNNCATVTTNGQNCTVSVFFNPTISGLRTGTLSFKDMADGTTHTISLTGTGITTTTPPPPATTSTFLVGGTNGSVITTNNFDDLRVFQFTGAYNSAGNSKQITVTGSYTGTPGTIKVGVVDATNHATIVAAPVTATASGGTFTATLTVPARSGWNVIETYDGAAPSTVGYGTNRFGVGIIWHVIGQSNGVFMTSYLPSSLTPDQFTSNFYTSLNVYGTLHAAGTWGPVLGTGMIKFASRLRAAFNYNVAVADYAQTSTAINSWLTNSGSCGGTVNGSSWTAFTSGSGGLTNSTSGPHIGNDFLGVTLVQGEANASGGTSKATYKSSVQIIACQLLALTGRSASQFGFGIASLGSSAPYQTSTDARWDAIRQAHLELVRDNPTPGDFFYAGAEIDNRQHLPPQDQSPHWETGSTGTNNYYARMGLRWVPGVANHFGISGFTGGSSGPKITSVVASSATTVDFVVTHSGGSALRTTDGGTTGTNLTLAGTADANGAHTPYRVFINGTQTQVLGAVFVQPNIIRLTVPSYNYTGDTVAGDYSYGMNGNVTTWVMAYDNNTSSGDSLAPGLPLEPSLGLISSSGSATPSPTPVPDPTPTPTPTPSGTLSQGLIAYYSFDQSTVSGTSVSDLSGSGHSGTLVNGPSITAGKFGEALSLNAPGATTQRMDVTGGVPMGTTGTIAFWIYPTAFTPSFQAVAANTTTGNAVYIHGSQHSTVSYYPTKESVKTLPLNQWSHVAVVVTNGTVNFYLNGVLDTNVGSAATAWTLTRIGTASSASYYFPGSLDDYRVYNRALSASEIQSLYGGQLAVAGGSGIFNTLSSLVTSLTAKLSSLMNPASQMAAVTLSQISLDFGTATVGQSSESQTVSVTTIGTTATPTATLSASPASITTGQSSTLTWSSTNATSCTGTGFTATGISGSVTVTPAVTSAYSVNCNGAVSNATVTVSPVTPSTIQIGSRVKTTVNLNVRDKANTRAGKILCVQPVGALGTVILGPSSAQQYIWWQINYDTSCDGWSAVDGGYLVTTN